MRSCAPGLWPGAQLYIRGMLMSCCLTDRLTVWLSDKVEDICQDWCYESNIWYGAFLGSLNKIQGEPMWRTLWGPCSSHKWEYVLEKGAYGTYSKLLNVSRSVPWHIDYDSGVIKRRDHLRIISFGHIMVIYWILLGLLMSWVVKWMFGHSCGPLVSFISMLSSVWIWLYLTTRLEVSEVGFCDQQKVEISQKLDCCKVGMLSWSSR